MLSKFDTSWFRNPKKSTWILLLNINGLFLYVVPLFCCVGGLMVILFRKDNVVLRKAHKVGLMEVHCPFLCPLTSQQLLFLIPKILFKKTFQCLFTSQKINQIGVANTSYKGLVKIFSMLCQAFQLKVICLSKSIFKWSRLF